MWAKPQVSQAQYEKPEQHYTSSPSNYSYKNNYEFYHVAYKKYYFFLQFIELCIKSFLLSLLFG